MQLSDYTFGLRGHDIGNDFPSMCKNAADNGITSIQFAMTKTVRDIDFDAIGFDEKVAENICRKLREYNLSIPVLSCYINPINTDEEGLEVALRRFEVFIQYAAVFGAGVVGTETGVTVRPEHPNYAETYRLFMRSMERLVENAERFDVNIGIEPTRFGTVCSPQVMWQVIKDIGSERVKVILDLSNQLTVDTISSQRKILDDSFELFPDRICTVHLKDFQIVDGKKMFAPPGEGMMDISYLFKLLSGVQEKPAIILDELKLENYREAMVRLGVEIY